MLLERDRKLFHLFAVISIALSLLVCIPYSLAKVTLFEIIVKYMVVPPNTNYNFIQTSHAFQITVRRFPTCFASPIT